MALPPKLKRWLILAGVLAASVSALVFAAYVLDLDREVRTRFAGARWALPAQVYAAPTLLYPGANFDKKALAHELDRLGYRLAPRLSGPGSYSVAASRVAVHTRPFGFWDGPQDSVRVMIDFESSGIANVTDLDTKEARPLVRLDPMLIGSIYPTAGEDRVLVKLDEVPPLLPAGLIYIEDRSFAHHVGIDPKAILRATFANLRAGHAVQGGSTITQQLVRNFFLTLERKWSRKLNEAIMAVLLEAHYSKDEILEAYLNEVHLGQDGGRAVHGFGLASQFYFNKPLSELQPQEIALLVALVKGPSYYNPRKHPERAKERRDLVLENLAEAGLLTATELQIALKKPLGVKSEIGGNIARYPAFVDLVKRQLTGQYADADLTNEGLRIFTTLEPRAQEALEKNLTEGLPRLEKSRARLRNMHLEGAGVVTSVEDGKVLALAGGRDVRFAGFNRALDARRPIGSLAKPFVYLSALMQPDRYSLASPLQDVAIEIQQPNGETWAPQNYDKVEHGAVPLFVALANSYNLATVHLGMDMGIPTVREIFRAAGMQDPPPPVPALFLGAVDLAPLEVAQMYGTLAAGGYQTPLLAIREVVTKEGQPLSHYPLHVRQTLPEVPVYLLNWNLEQVLRHGTATSAYNYIAPSVRLAGKTGTTDDLRDSWFAGYGEDRVVVIWVGRDDNQSAGLTGAEGALQIWAPLMRDLKVRSFNPQQPDGVETAWANLEDGGRADSGCTGALEIPYAAGHAPTGASSCSGLKTIESWFKNLTQ